MPLRIEMERENEIDWENEREEGRRGEVGRKKGKWQLSIDY